jgi:predicted CDP-diglyceride synthetase/phosphatidate cytidylyltransferase
MTFVKKYRLYIDLMGIFLFGYMCYVFFDRYLNEGRKNLNIVFAVFAFLMVILKITDVIEYIRKKKIPERKNNS